MDTHAKGWKANNTEHEFFYKSTKPTKTISKDLVFTLAMISLLVAMVIRALTLTN